MTRLNRRRRDYRPGDRHSQPSTGFVESMPAPAGVELFFMTGRSRRAV